MCSATRVARQGVPAHVCNYGWKSLEKAAKVRKNRQNIDQNELKINSAKTTRGRREGDGKKCHDNLLQTSRQFTTFYDNLCDIYDKFRLFVPLT